MNFGQTRRRFTTAVNERKGAHGTTSCDAPYNMQLYRDPPRDVIGLEEFDDIAWHRFKVLQAIEDLKERFRFFGDEFKREAKRIFSNSFPVAFPPTATEWTKLSPEVRQKWRRDDLIGHFVLRLAFCRTSEDIKWLTQLESDLLGLRFQMEVEARRDSIAQFLHDNNVDVTPVDPKERDSLAEILAPACAYRNTSTLKITDFWKLWAVDELQCVRIPKADFTAASKLVKARRCLLLSGTAYFPLDDLKDIVCAQFKEQVKVSMNRAFPQLGMLNEEQRLLPRLQRLANRAYSGKQYVGAQADGITRHMINELSESFPMCMRTMHERLRRDHHLRYEARQQYGLFLKAIGLPLEEALLFMREEFTKKIDSDKFEKQYGYNIRHMYGKEGARKDYPAKPCKAIILGAPPGPLDCHGCPFKHNEPKLLAQRLERDSRLSKQQVEMIVNLAQKSQFDKACTRHLEFTHKMGEDGLSLLITHPNQYFELSREIRSGKRKEEHVQVIHSLPVSKPASSVAENGGITVEASTTEPMDDSF